MIRGPVLPQAREGLWSLVSVRLDQIERGLTLAMEAFDCSGGQLGAVEGLARDAAGGPVLVILALDGDALLVPRVLAAADFLQRVGDALVEAVPEAQLAVGARGRVLAIGTDASHAAIEALRRLPVAGLQVCRLEPFRVAGSERFAVRHLAVGAPASSAAEPEPVVDLDLPGELSGLWASCRDLCARIDPAVRLVGDRYSRRILWRSALLGEVCYASAGLQARVGDGVATPLQVANDVRHFVDQLLRRYARVAGLHREEPNNTVCASPEATRSAPTNRMVHRGGGEGLRAAVAAAKLSSEEYSALGGPALAAGGDADGAAAADDVVKIVAAQEGPWPPTRRSTD
jgi:hypothetical protein